ncbi:MAG: GTPase HflX, partial [Oscillospiraceae bacterium]|nr:GTPase HflX [Oscillospiraceae bacterium]
MREIHGNTIGIRRSYIERLESIYDVEIERKEFCTVPLLNLLAAFTGNTGREAMAYVDRTGHVLCVAVGERDRVELPFLRIRRSPGRLAGIRCIHTHPGGNGALSDVDIQSLKSIRLDAMAAVGVSGGRPVWMQVGILDQSGEDSEEGDGLTVNLHGPYRISGIPHETLLAEIRLADVRIRPDKSKKADAEIARAILAGIDNKQTGTQPLSELLQLANTAGFITVGSMVQPRDRPDRSYYLGYGKLRDLTLEIGALRADAVIFDDELSPAQIRNIQKEFGESIEIIDRTALILDIFSGRAATHEGRLQVELAQAKYMLPRMAGYWKHLSRMGGGGGGGAGARRGEGETQLEVDRRILRRRLVELEKEIDNIKSRRDVQRAHRERSGIPVAALVGYTNAGKSSLLNSLSGSDVLAEDKLFATLDPVSRRVNFGGGDLLLVDTVGFINKLSHDLVDAFRATLEETKYADLLIHVVDASSDDSARQMEVVKSVLGELGVWGKPILTVYNKCDIAGDFIPGTDSVRVSAITGMGMENLKAAVVKSLAAARVEISVILPLDSGALVSRIYATGQVSRCSYEEDGIHITALVS